MRFVVSSAAFSALIAAQAHGGELALNLTIPRLTVAEYHKPYLAIWLEHKADKKITNLAVWYDFKMKNNEGAKWLKDMRQWWRVSGRDLDMPVDGITGATRAPGDHVVTFDGAKAPLAALPAGTYDLVVEAAREVGGREILRIPFTWPAGEQVSAEAAGAREIGSVTLAIKP